MTCKSTTQCVPEAPSPAQRTELSVICVKTINQYLTASHVLKFTHFTLMLATATASAVDLIPNITEYFTLSSANLGNGPEMNQMMSRYLGMCS